MKALLINHYGSIADLSLNERAKPEIQDNEVLVKIHAAALNPADLKIITGKDGGSFLHAKNFPYPPGFDYSGMIEAVGAQVADFKLGDEIFGFLSYSRANKAGTLAEYIAVPTGTFTTKPSGVSHFRAAAAGTAGCTALISLRNKGRLKRGQRVFINGASGGVGSYAVKIAKLMGAEVWGTCSAKNMHYVSSLGADRVLDYKMLNLSEVSEHFHLFFDTAAKLSYSETRQLLHPGGTYVTLLPSPQYVVDKIKSFFGATNCRMVIVKPNSPDLTQISQWLAEGLLEVAIASKFTLETAKEALQQLDRGVNGKIVIKIG